MATKKKINKSGFCSCFEEVNKGLEEKNGELDYCIARIPGFVAAVPRITILKKDTGNRKVKPPGFITPNYCPFCGSKYPEIN